MTESDSLHKRGVESTSRLDKLPDGLFKVALFAATIVWGGGYTAMKGAVDVFAPATLLGVRFSLAALLVLIVFIKPIKRSLDKRTFLIGLLLGTLFFLAFWAQTIGLTDTTPGKNAFLTATFCVLTPFAYWAVGHRRPTVQNILIALVCLFGIGLVSLNGDFQMRFGDAMTLVGALFYALHIAVLGRYSQTSNVFPLLFMQFAVCGVWGLLIGLPFEAQPSLQAVFDLSTVGQMAYLVLLATFFACSMQNIGQSRIPPNQASIILSLESVFGVLFSVLLYGETLTLRVILGFAVIFIAIVADELLATKELSWRKKTT